jgi:oxygen-independent coproporphyrinogen-3 oxidase
MITFTSFFTFDPDLNSMAGLYIHIPFCKQACHYCDFYFSTNQQSVSELCNAIATEITTRTAYLEGEQIETIYFGGGTPSILSPTHLQQIIAAVAGCFTIAPNAEITLEANPDDLSQQKLHDLRTIGINRLSIGIQSFSDQVLTFLNRAHTTSDAANCIAWARTAGFSNISIDLMYAIPDQDDAQWKVNIQQALQLNPEHISAYSLTIEEKTVFGQWHKKGKLPVVEDAIAASQFELLMAALQQAGYQHYEISNFCKPGYYSRHNSGYWQQKKYLGVGPSAHSYDLASRQYNISNNHLYIKAISNGTLPFEKEILTQHDKINEYVFTTLRTSWGCDLNYLQNNLNFDLRKEFAQALKSFENQSLIEIHNNIITLTAKGKLFADKIASDLFVAV